MPIIGQQDNRSTHLQGGLSLSDAVDRRSSRSAVIKSATFHIRAVASGVQQDTLFDLPADAIVDRVVLQVRTPEVTGTTKTLSFGTVASESGGNATLWFAAQSVAAAGVFLSGTVNYLTSSVTAKSIAFTLGSANFVELVADVHLFYTVFEDRIGL